MSSFSLYIYLFFSFVLILLYFNFHFADFLFTFSVNYFSIINVVPTRNLPFPGIISQMGGTTMRLDHLSTTGPDSKSYWHMNMRGKNLLGVSSFPSAYDAELMAMIGGQDCFYTRTFQECCLRPFGLTEQERWIGKASTWVAQRKFQKRLTLRCQGTRTFPMPRSE